MAKYGDIGKSIFNATLIVARAWKETALMMDELQERLEKLLSEAGLVKANRGFVYADKEDQELLDPGEYVCEKYTYTYELISKGPGARKPFGYLTFEVVMADEDVSSVGIDESFVNILYGDEVWTIDEFYFPPINTVKRWEEQEEDGGEYHYGCSLRYERLWEFRWDEMGQPWWAFSVPLAVLNSVDDLDKQIVIPVVKLLEGEPTEKAMAAADRVLRFEGDCHECRRVIV